MHFSEIKIKKFSNLTTLKTCKTNGGRCRIYIVNSNGDDDVSARYDEYCASLQLGNCEEKEA